MTARLLVAVAAGAAVIVGGASPAAAHAGDASGPTNYETNVADMDPQVSGLRVRSVDLSNGIELRNRTGKSVIVFGYEDEPYLRIDDDGVFENERSPATYLNVSRDGSADIPKDADPDAEPKWRKVSDGDTVQWHDHRAHWMSSNDPPAVREDPTRSHVVLEDWKIPLTVGDEAVTVTGNLTWTPGPSPWLFWLTSVAAGAALFAAVWFLRRWRRHIIVAALVLGTVVSLWQTVGYATAPNQSASVLQRYAEAGVLLAFTWIGGLIAAWWMRGRRAGEAAILGGMAGLALFVSGGLADSSAFARAHVGSAWGDGAGRFAVAASIALGGALVASAVAAARRRWFGQVAT